MKKSATTGSQPKQQRRSLLAKAGAFFAGIWRIAKENLSSEDVFKRMGALALWTGFIFIIVWLVSFILLRAKVFEGTWLTERIFGISAPKGMHKPGTGPDLNYWPRVLLVSGKIFLHYLILTVMIFLLNHLRVGRTNLGYIFFFIYVAFMAVVVGTNGFPYYAATKLGALITFVRFALWQLIALMLAAVATSRLALFATPGWINGIWAKIRPLNKLGLKGEDFEVLLYAFLILIAASIAEARLVDFYSLYY